MQIKEHVIYGFFDDDRCVYIGRTTAERVHQRRWEHKHRSAWWHPALTFSEIGRFLGTLADANNAEGDLIRTFAPRYNIQIPA